MNFDGLKDAVIRMLAGESGLINTGTFSNDMTTFTGRDDVLTLLVHLGYLITGRIKRFSFRTKRFLRNMSMPSVPWTGMR